MATTATSVAATPARQATPARACSIFIFPCSLARDTVGPVTTSVSVTVTGTAGGGGDTPATAFDGERVCVADGCEAASVCDAAAVRVIVCDCEAGLGDTDAAIDADGVRDAAIDADRDTDAEMVALTLAEAVAEGGLADRDSVLEAEGLRDVDRLAASLADPERDRDWDTDAERERDRVDDAERLALTLGLALRDCVGVRDRPAVGDTLGVTVNGDAEWLGDSEPLTVTLAVTLGATLGETVGDAGSDSVGVTLSPLVGVTLDDTLLLGVTELLAAFDLEMDAVLVADHDTDAVLVADRDVDALLVADRDTDGDPDTLACRLRDAVPDGVGVMAMRATALMRLFT